LGRTALVSDGKWDVVGDCLEADDPELADIISAEKAGKQPAAASELRLGGHSARPRRRGIL
jgi:hypothetical protein